MTTDTDRHRHPRAPPHVQTALPLDTLLVISSAPTLKLFNRRTDSVGMR